MSVDLLRRVTLQRVTPDFTPESAACTTDTNNFETEVDEIEDPSGFWSLPADKSGKRKPSPGCLTDPISHRCLQPDDTVKVDKICYSAQELSLWADRSYTAHVPHTRRVMGALERTELYEMVNRPDRFRAPMVPQVPARPDVNAACDRFTRMMFDGRFALSDDIYMQWINSITEDSFLKLHTLSTHNNNEWGGEFYFEMEQRGLFFIFHGRAGEYGNQWDGPEPEAVFPDRLPTKNDLRRALWNCVFETLTVFFVDPEIQEHFGNGAWDINTMGVEDRYVEGSWSTEAEDF